MSNLYTGLLLKKLRKEYDYTLEKIAKMLGVTKSAVSKWENGDDIKTKHLYELAKIYNVSFSELYQGKLKNESNKNFWKRNYDLSNFNISDNITSKDLDDVKLFYERCKNIKLRFFYFLPRWCKEKLNKEELEEFYFLKEYFEFDNRYNISKNEFKILRSDLEYLENEKCSVLTYIEKIEYLNKEEYQWELSKLYDFTYDRKISLIMKSDNIKAMEYMISSLNQVEKDKLLNENLVVTEIEEKSFNIMSDGLNTIKTTSVMDRTNSEIEAIPYFKALINSKAMVLYKRKACYSFIDRELIDFVKGVKKELNEENRLITFPIYEKWKEYSYMEYMSYVDKEKTEEIRDIVNIKDSNPILYYKNMAKRDLLI